LGNSNNTLVKVTVITSIFGLNMQWKFLRYFDIIIVKDNLLSWETVNKTKARHQADLKENDIYYARNI